MTISSGFSASPAVQRASSDGAAPHGPKALRDGVLLEPCDPDDPGQGLKRLALAIVGPYAEAADLELAHRVAEAEGALRGVRQITSHLLASPGFEKPERAGVLLRGLTALQRRQRRALAQRNAAALALEERAICGTPLEEGARPQNAEAMGAQACVNAAVSEETAMANEAEHGPEVATGAEDAFAPQVSPESTKKPKPKADKKSAPKAKRSAPARKVERPPRTELQLLFGAPPVLDHESVEEYDALHERIRAAVGTRDFIAEFLARDLCDLTWEILRLRRMKAKFLNNAMADGLRRLLAGRETAVPDYVDRWRKGDPRVLKDLPEWLDELGLDMEDASAQAAIVVADSLARFDTVIHQAELRRNSVLRDADRHQDALTRRLHDITVEIEDAEFRQLEAGEIAP